MVKIDKNINQRLTLLQTLFAARRDALIIELVLVIAIISIIIVIALPTYETIIYKVHKIRLYPQLDAIRTTAIIEYSITGKWSSQSKTFDDENQSPKLKIEQIWFDQGNYAMVYGIPKEDKIYTEGYRLVHSNELQPTLYWLCGYADARKDEVVIAANVTDAPLELLNYNCRQKRNSK